MKQLATFEETREALLKGWQIEAGNLPEATDPMEVLRQLLAQKLLQLLNDDFSFLVSTMYRLDIPEYKFHEAMALSVPDKIAEALSHIVLQREIIRIDTRKRYSQSKPKTD